MSSTTALDARLVFSLDFELNPPMVVGSRIIYGFTGKATGGIVGELSTLFTSDEATRRSIDNSASYTANASS